MYYPESPISPDPDYVMVAVKDLTKGRALRYLNWSLALAIFSWVLAVLLIAPPVLLTVLGARSVEESEWGLLGAIFVIIVGMLLSVCVSSVAGVVGLISSTLGLVLGFVGYSIDKKAGKMRFYFALGLHLIFLLIVLIMSIFIIVPIDV